MIHMIFDCFTSNKISEEEKKTDVKSSDNNPWYYISKIYDIIDKKDRNHKESLDNLFKKIDESEFYFITWVLNHNLAYHSNLRNYAEAFTALLIFYTRREYVYFYVWYMIKNNVKFPKFMPWYKFNIGNEDKDYKAFLADNYNIIDEELEQLCDYCSEKSMSLKDICINLQIYNQIQKEKK